MDYTFFYQSISVIGAFLGIFISLNLIFIKSNNRTVNLILALMLILYAIPQLERVVQFTGFYKDYPHLAMFSYPLFALRPPLFYLLIRNLVEPQRSLKALDLVHLTGFAFMVFSASDYLLMPANDKVWVLESMLQTKGHQIDWQGLQIVYRNVAYALTYLLVALFLIRKKIKSTDEENQTKDLKQLQRFKGLTLIYLGIPLFILFVHTYHYLTGSTIAYLDIYCNVAFTLLLTAMASLLFQSPSFFSVIKGAKRSFSRKGYNAVDLDGIVDLIKEHNLFKHAELKAFDVARTAHVSAHALQESIKNDLGLTFTDFVNQIRTSEFIKRIKAGDHRHFTLLALAYDSGFNSKASFNRNFKKQTGYTPSQYVDMIETNVHLAV